MDLEEFLKVCNQFKLGKLVTEQPHPETTGLAENAQRDLSAAISQFHNVDLLCMERVMQSLAALSEMVQSIKRTITGGGRIYIAGCGATGRLALSLETLAREAWLSSDRQDLIVSFMAGGDAALIRSIESFEDYPDYGARQLKELGFSEKDLLLAITEGGETPFVIGACLAASEISIEAPWFLFCNPPAILKSVAERSRSVLESPKVRSFFLDTGPMALSGSTRLQATTVEMLVAGAALMEGLGKGNALETIEAFKEWLQGHDPGFLAPFIEAEANVYRDKNLVLYRTDHYGITVLTDTTERAPTFSLAPFENRNRKDDALSWCYLSIEGAPTATAAWHTLLHRSPRTLEWDHLKGKASCADLMGHDISEEAPSWRAERHPGLKQYPFLVYGRSPIIEFGGTSHAMGLEAAPLLLRHLALKCCLNLHSTLLMGRLGRFQSNLMTYVKPSNYKLIDRAARYRQNQYNQETGKSLDYEVAVREVFASLK